MQVDVTVGKAIGVLTLVGLLISGGWQAFHFVSEAHARDAKIESNQNAIQANRSAGAQRDDTLERIADLLEVQEERSDDRLKIRRACAEGRINDTKICSSESIE